MTRICFSISVAVCVVASFAPKGAGATTQQTSGNASNGVTIPLLRSRGNLLLPVKIGGRDVGNFFLDLRSADILIDQKVSGEHGLKEIGIKWGGSNDAKVGTLVDCAQITTGPLQSRMHLAVATDLSGWHDWVGAPISGVLGWGFLCEHPFSIDFQRSTLTTYTDDQLPRQTGVELPLKLVDAGVPVVPAQIDDDIHGWFMFDPGNDAAFRVFDSFVATHPEIFREEPRPLAAVPSHGTLNVSRFSSFSFAEQSFSSVVGAWRIPPAQHRKVNGLIPSGSIGMPVLKDLTLTFDYRGRRMWVQRQLPETPVQSLKRLGDPTGRDAAGVTPLMRALIECDGAVVRQVLQEHPNLDANDSNGQTALMYACQHADVDLVRLLLKLGASADLADHQGLTALMRASVSGSREIAQMLLDAGCAVDKLDQNGRSALHWAALGNHPDLVRLLLSHHAALSHPSNEGDTALVDAAYFGDADALEALLDAGASPNERIKGTPVLSLAAGLRRSKAVSVLLKHKADPNAMSDQHTVPLTYAAMGGANDSIRILLAAGANPDGCTDSFSEIIQSGRLHEASLIFAARAKAAGRAGAWANGAKYTSLPCRCVGNLLFLPVDFRGLKGWALMDTGSNFTIVDKSVLEHLHQSPQWNIPVGGINGKSVMAGIAGIDGMSVGGISLPQTLVATMDLSGVSKSCHMDNVLCVGMPFLDTPITFDYPAQKIVVYDDKDFKPPASEPSFEMRRIGEDLCIQASLFNGRMGWFGIDTGAQSELSPGINRSLYDPQWLPSPFAGRSSPAFAGRTDNLLAWLPWMNMLGRKISSVIATTALPDNIMLGESSLSGQIDGGLLQDCRLTINPADHMAWAQWIPKNESLDAFLRRIGPPGSDSLMKAVSSGREDAAEALLRQGADPNAQPQTDISPLDIACMKGNDRIIDLLVRYHARLELSNIEFAASRSDSTAVERLIKAGLNVKGKDLVGVPALVSSVLGNDAKSIELMLQAGADPNASDGEGTTALTNCASFDAGEAAKVLLSHGANVDVSEKDGKTPLMLATLRGHANLIKILAEHHAKLNLQDKDGKTALMLATTTGDPEVVRLLLDLGADTAVQDPAGNTALNLAAQSGNFMSVSRLYLANRN